MSAKGSEWRPGPTVCRCCLAEGCYKDISTEYFWMGKREVYSEMLSNTFDVAIAYSQSSGPNSNSRLICEPCISRLRDASDFKRQVLECEKTFMHHLDPGRTAVPDVDLHLPSVDNDVKLERVKEESKLSDDEFDDRADGAFADDDDDDDLDDQPLTRLASKIPKKETVDLMDLLDNAKAEKRKSTSKIKASPSKKAKKKEIPKPTMKPPKATASKSTPKVEKKKKDNYAMAMARRNARIIIENATAYPFRLPEGSPVCVFCFDTHDDPSQFRKHMEDDHQTFKVNLAFAHLHEGYLKADTTDLRCRICSNQFKKLEDIATHLNGAHNKGIDVKYDLGIQPFTIERNKWYCALCTTKFNNLRSLSRHTQKHFVKFTCDTCGKSYSTSTSLNHHITYSHLSNNRVCRKCKKSFATLAELREHALGSKRCCQHVCSVCGERFYTWVLKQTHLREAHATPQKSYPCPECSSIFDTRDGYRIHFKISHTNDHFDCSCCGRKFDTEYRLKRHMVSHTGEKIFQCEFCSKAFPRKSTLDQHLWIHREVKKWKCEPCNKQFNQRVSWRTHMKGHHPERTDI